MAIQCKKMLWLDTFKKEEKEEDSSTSVLENGTEVGILAKDFFSHRVDILFHENLKQMILDTNEALKIDSIVITEASFLYDGNFCSVDILVKEKDEYEIIEVKSSTEVHDIYKEDVAFQYYILQRLGFKLKKASIMYLNANYVRQGDLDLNKLFLFQDVTSFCEEHLSFVEENIQQIKEYMINTATPLEDIGVHCYKPYDCPFFSYCTRHLPEKNIFLIRSMQRKKKMELYHQGVFDYKNLLEENINPKYKQQIEFELYDLEPYKNVKKIKEFLDTLYYPLYFLDFETYQESVPSYDGMSPYMQVPFQYSLHYLENKNSILQHKEFLSDALIDPRRILALSLVRDIPKNACILAYNMSFEKMVIRSLAREYDDLKVDLMHLHDHIRDLMVPFVNRDYYQKEMLGSYSIKYVLPALFPDDESLNYHNLEMIHNGSEASRAYLMLSHLDEEKQKEVRENLLKYCGLDTLAMVKIYEKLQEVVLEKVS